MGIQQALLGVGLPPPSGLVVLTNRLIPQYYDGEGNISQLVLNNDGTALYIDEVGDYQFISGQWWIGAPSFTIGASYEVTCVPEAGAAPFVGGNTIRVGSWGLLSVYPSLYWDYGLTGRARISIRNATTGAPEASAQIWNHSMWAP